MIEKILDRLEAEINEFMKDVPDGDYLRGNVNFCAIAKEIVQEVAKEYEGRTCANCKYEMTPGDFEPCCVCRNACSDDCFEPKDAPCQKGE